MSAPLETYLARAGVPFVDLRASLPDVPSSEDGKRFGTRPLGGIDTIAVHHTAGAATATWQSVRAFHVETRRWSGIGYHIGVRQGVVAYLGDVATQRACVGQMNHRVICLCVAGDFTREPLSIADANAVRRTVAAVQLWAEDEIGHTLRVKGHGELPGQSTACPGPPLLTLARQIAAGAPPSPAPTPGAPSFAKVAWFLEDAQRRCEAEGLAAESAFIGAAYTADAKRRASGA